MFPVASKSKIEAFNSETTNFIENRELSEALTKIDEKGMFQTGRCYGNAELIVNAGRNLGLNIEFYAGWLFLGDEVMPIHHAVAVFEGNIIDVSNTYEEMYIQQTADYSNPNWRNIIAPKLLKAREKKLEFYKKYPFGKLYGNYVFVGSPDTADNARRLYSELVNNFPSHPCGFIMPGEGSAMQKAMGADKKPRSREQSHV